MQCEEFATATGANYQFTEQDYLWQPKVRESMAFGQGMTTAFDWRDTPDQDSRAGT